MVEACVYCINQASEIISCTTSCLASANIPPAYPGSILLGSVVLSLTFFFLASYFRNNLKRFIGFRLIGLAFLSTAFFTVGLIFNGHYILKNLPMIIPLIGTGSYVLSYFLSFYLIRLSYKPMVFENNTFQEFLARISKKMDLKLPDIYVFFSKKPGAFAVDGFKKAIFISDSLIEKLDGKSIKAVLLHELYHLKRRTGMIKSLITSMATLNFRLMPVPINELDMYEEEEIDKILLKEHGIDMEKVKSKLWS